MKASSLAFLIPLLLPLLLLLPGISGYPFSSQQAQYSDLAITHLPNALFLKETLVQQRQVPLWSPLILSGLPFFAHPLSGLWYPPGWLALFFPLPFGLNLVSLLHLLWGAAGMARFLRGRQMSIAAALFGAAGFALLPRLFAHFGAGHLTLVYAVCWLPWLLWAAAAPVSRFPVREGAILAAIFLADVRWALYAGLLWAGYRIWLGYDAHRLSLRSAARSTARQMGLQLLAAAAFSAPLALPLWEFTRLSSRVSLSPVDFASFSLPVPRLLGLLAADFASFHEWQVYPGVLVSILALLAIPLLAAAKEKGFWLGVAVFGLIFSLGDQAPFMDWIARLPGFQLLRVPARAVILVQFSLLTLASMAVDGLSAPRSLQKQKWLRRILFSLVCFCVIFLLGLWRLSGGIPPSFAWSGAVFLLGAACLAFCQQTAVRQIKIIPFVLLFLCLLDWWAIDRSLFVYKPAGQVDAQAAALAEELSQQTPPFRVYSPSYSLPQQTAARFGLELADGVDPLQLRSSLEFMQRASGVPFSGYSVTVPPFASGDPQTDNQNYLPDAGLLGMLNVRYVLSAFALDARGLEFRTKQDGIWVYENLSARPRAWVEGASREVPFLPAQLLKWTPNQILLRAEGPGLLLLSEVAYPGWQSLAGWSSGGDANGLRSAARSRAASRRTPGQFRLPPAQPVGWAARCQSCMGDPILLFVEEAQERARL